MGTLLGCGHPPDVPRSPRLPPDIAYNVLQAIKILGLERLGTRLSRSSIKFENGLENFWWEQIPKEIRVAASLVMSGIDDSF